MASWKPNRWVNVAIDWCLISHELTWINWSEFIIVVFCYSPRTSLYGSDDGKKSCSAKDGNPFGPFWDTFNIDFDNSEFYGPLYYDTENKNTAKEWEKR